MVSEGQTAPDFIAPAASGSAAEMVELFDEVERSEAAVLLFYPADFVPACTAELCAVRDAGWAGTPGLTVLGIGGDSLFAHAAYADQYDLGFRLVSDFHGGIADNYGLLADDWEGHREIPRRATVVLDGDWKIRFVDALDDALAQASPAPVERATDTLEELGLDVRTPRVDYDGPW